MKYMYLLFTLGRENGRIEKWKIQKEEYDNGMKYYIERPKDSLLRGRYKVLVIDEKYMAHNEVIIAAFSPKCALLKHIMHLNNEIIDFGERLGNKVEIIYSQIHQAKKELERYL